MTEHSVDLRWVSPQRGAVRFQDRHLDLAALEEAFSALAVQLAEHPAMRSHLQSHGIRVLNTNGILRFIPSKGVTLRERQDWHIALYHDPELRPLFDEFRLTVQEGDV